MNTSKQALTMAASASAALDLTYEMFVKAVARWRHLETRVRPAKLNLRAQQKAVTDQQDMIDYLRGECPVRARTRRHKDQFYGVHCEEQKIKGMLRRSAIAKSDLRKLRREIFKIKMVIYPLRQKLTRLENLVVTEAVKMEVQEAGEILGGMDEEVPPDKIPDRLWVELTWGTA